MTRPLLSGIQKWCSCDGGGDAAGVLPGRDRPGLLDALWAYVVAGER